MCTNFFFAKTIAIDVTCPPETGPFEAGKF
jgi:hypothetical protein